MYSTKCCTVHFVDMAKAWEDIVLQHTGQHTQPLDNFTTVMLISKCLSKDLQGKILFICCRKRALDYFFNLCESAYA